jgi:DNA polymerase-3 subunit gamma/tau
MSVVAASIGFVVTALYRRYRPENFAEMIGQSQVTDPLMTALRTNRVNHAYLFSGPRGCGKTTSARILARCLNCAEGPTDTPCGVCPSCVELGRDGGGSLDVVEIDAASHNGVDDARDLRERAVFAPARDRYKIFILDEAHMVTPQGFNALLKIVEEPPEHIKFIFATTEPDKVIGTIRSRTHHYPFRLIPSAQMLEYVQHMCDLEGVTVEPGVLPLVVRAGGGSARDTLSLLDQLMAGSDGTSVDYERAVALLGYTHATLLDDAVEALGSRDAAAAFNAVDRVIQTGQDPRRFVDDLLERLRDLIVVGATGAAGAQAVLRGIPQDELDRMAVQADSFGQAELSRTADIVNAALSEMTGATSPKLHLELMTARILVPSMDDSSRGALARVERLERRVGVDVAGGNNAELAPRGDAARSGGGAAGAPARAAAPAQAPAPARTSAQPATATQAPASSRTQEPSGEQAPARAQAAGADSSTAAAAQAAGVVAASSSDDAATTAATGEALAKAAAASWGIEVADTTTEPAAARSTSARRSTESSQAESTQAGSTPAEMAGDAADENPSNREEASSEAPSVPTKSVPTKSVPNKSVPNNELSANEPLADQPLVDAADTASPGADQVDAPVAADTHPAAASAPGAAEKAPDLAAAPAVPAADLASPVSDTAAAPVSLQQLKDAWPEILERVADTSRPAWLVAATATVRALQGDILTLTFPSHNDVEGFKRADAGEGPSEWLRRAIVDVLGIRVKYIARVDPGPGSGGSRGPAAGPRDGEPGAPANAPRATPAPAGSPQTDDARTAASAGAGAASSSSSSSSSSAPARASSPGRPGNRAAATSSATAANVDDSGWHVVAIPQSDISSDDNDDSSVAAPEAAAAPGKSTAAVAPANSAAPAATDAEAPPVDDEPPYDDMPPPEDDEAPFPDPGFGSAAPTEASPWATPSSGPAIIPPVGPPPVVPPRARPAAAPAAAAPDVPAPAVARAKKRAAEPKIDPGPTAGHQSHPAASTRYGEAVVRELLGATFLEEQPHVPATRFNRGQ